MLTGETKNEKGALRPPQRIPLRKSYLANDIDDTQP
jgi:hypothetical protein